jgi:hypothetical protein
VADSLSVSITGDKELIAVLEAAITHAVPESIAIVTKGSQNIKTDWRRSWAGIRHAKRLPMSITYDVEGSWRGVSSEIGPEDGADNQGFLAPIIEFGGIHNAPRPGGLPALANEEPKFQAAIEAMSAKLLP